VTSKLKGDFSIKGGLCGSAAKSIQAHGTPFFKGGFDSPLPSWEEETVVD